MNIWTSRPLAALGLLVLLAACEETSNGDRSTSIAPQGNAAGAPVPLTRADMMRGGVTLVPPEGFCIDPESLTQSFALMARCDALGAPTGGAGAPLGVLTVSFTRSPVDEALPDAADIATAANVAPPRDVKTTETSVIFQTEGDAPSEGLAASHWRAVAKFDRFIMGAALFGPENRRAVSSEGAEVLRQMITRSAAK